MPVKLECIDTNVIVRFLVETPASIEPKFRGVFAFFDKLESGATSAFLPDIVLLQAYFVLTSHYGVPRAAAAEKLEAITSLRGVHLTDRRIMAGCLHWLTKENIDIVDAWLLEHSRCHGIAGVYSFDRDLEQRGLELLPVE